jgi:hypothetical protein
MGWQEAALLQRKFNIWEAVLLGKKKQGIFKGFAPTGV